MEAEGKLAGGEVERRRREGRDTVRNDSNPPSLLVRLKSTDPLILCKTKNGRITKHTDTQTPISKIHRHTLTQCTLDPNTKSLVLLDLLFHFIHFLIIITIRENTLEGAVCKVKGNIYVEYEKNSIEMYKHVFIRA